MTLKNYDKSSYRQYTGKSEAHKAFNSLRGIIDGISLDKKVNQKEIDELDKWCDKHEFLANTNPFNDLITNIQVIISDNVITEEEIEDMKWLCDKFEDGFNYYDLLTSDLQKLQGICHGVLADGIINDKEVFALDNWLSNHSHLSTFYPYDEISSLIIEVLADGKIDEAERNLLKKYFSEFVNLNDSELKEQIDEDIKDVKIGGICAIDPDIRFVDNQFCFTGTSTRSSRSQIAKLIEEYGGKYVNSISNKTNYLIIGDDGNPCWAYACYGRKVEKAINLRKEGSNIIIVHENDFWDEIEDRK
ncbi:MAG: BRCT domain-containing protein [Chitinophagales bacterium]